MDAAVVTTERMARFTNTTVTTERRGPSGGDGPVNGAVPRRSGDGDSGGGGQGGSDVVPGMEMNAEEQRDSVGSEGGGGVGRLVSRARQ
jgi:hypothetical protein